MMEFRIADTFTASLAKLTGEEQKAAKTTAFDPLVIQLRAVVLPQRCGKIRGPSETNYGVG